MNQSKKRIETLHTEVTNKQNLTFLLQPRFATMDATERRAKQVDQKLEDLTKTMTQLQTALPRIIASANSNSSVLTASKKSKSKAKNAKKNASGDDQILSRSDTQIILQKLKLIKTKVLAYEKEREQEKLHLAKVRDTMRNELLAIKKELMVNSLRQTPTDFRKYLSSQLLAVKDELLKIDTTQMMKTQISSNNITNPNKAVLVKIKSELLEIRKEMAAKIDELNSYKEYEQNFITYKKNLNKKLKNLKGAVKEYENELNATKEELERVKLENKDFQEGNMIPALLQTSITSQLKMLKEQVFQVETENKSFRMQLSGKDPLLSLNKSLFVTTIDMHTGGEPLRIIQNGIPSLSKQATLLKKRKAMMENYDYYRKFLMHEPRGHFDMYGVIICEPDDTKDADFGVLFMHNEGYSSMCGHAVLALGRYAVDFGLIKVDKSVKSNKQIVRIQCPCGIVTVEVECDKDYKSTGNVSFVSAPGWAEYISASIQLDQFGKVEVDIGYGGTYYAICPSTRFNLSVRDSPIDDLINISMLIKQTVIKKLALSNPDSKELEFIYGTILTDGMNDVKSATANVCVFADRQVDRCPTGSGVIARMAIDYAKKNVKKGEKRQFVGKTGSVFEGEIVDVLSNYKGKKDAVVVKVSGSAKYIGRCQFYLEDEDELGRGFLMN